MNRLAALALVLTLAGPATAAQADDTVRVAARLSAGTTTVGEPVTLEIVIETRGAAPGSIDLPALPPELRVAGTRDYSQLQYSLPGGRTRTLRREVVLSPSAPGQFVIAPIVVEVAGQRFRTRPLALRVTGAAPAAAPSGRGTGDEVVLRSWIEPADTVYLGQQLTLHGQALVADDVRLRLRRPPQYIAPSPTGFWMQELPQTRLTAPRIIDGRGYDVHEYRRAFFPLSPGTFVLPPARLRYEIRRGFLHSLESEELVADSIRLVVLPLPENGRPASFTGAVGRYRIDARLEPAEVPAGEAASLVVVVRGRGNVRGLPPPELPAMPGVQVFPPSEESELDIQAATITGVKRFAWVLVPHASGRIELPPIEYAFFDPERERYDVARSTALVLDVRPGTGELAAEPPVAAPRPLRPEPARRTLDWVRSPGFAAIQFLPFLALAWLVLARRRIGSGLAVKAGLSRRRRQALDALRGRAARPDPAFFDDVVRTARGWLADRLDAPGGRLPEDLPAFLETRGVASGIARATAGLLDRLDAARYTPDPPGPGTRRAWLDELDRLLEAVDRQGRIAWDTRGAGGVRGGAAVTGLLIAGFAAAGLPVLAPAAGAGAGTEVRATAAGSAVDPIPVDEAGPRDADEPEAIFRAAAAALAAGDPLAAAGGFLEFVDVRPRDPHGWYNLGGAYYAAGDPAHAVWAWLRAARLRPRDADVRHNLEVAGAPPDLVRAVSPWPPLSDEETLLAASLFWLLAAAAAIGFLRSRRRELAGAAALGAFLALLLLGSWAAPKLGPPHAVILEPETRILGSPAIRSELRHTAGPGTAVRVIDSRERWIRVRTRDGREGWVEADRLGRL